MTKEWREENAPIKHSEVTGKYALDWSIVEESALPESWQWVPLGNYAKCNRGKFSIRPRNDPSCFDGDYPFIQIGDLPRQGGFIYSHKQTLNEKGYSVSREFDAGTVVLAIVGATIANTGITTYPVCFPDSLVGINSASETTNKYLDYHLRAIKEDIRQASYAGGGQPNIKLTMVNPLPLPLPSEAEIVEIVAKVELLMARANKVENQYLDAKARLDRLTQSILAKAFRGELVPQDPNDEPAEKLLERIVAEKEQSKPKKTTRKRATKAKTAEKE
nr:restriction endonuclease subunit S [Vibrio aestuarianus]